MPTTVNPHLGTDTEGGWAMGFAWGFTGPAFSEEPPLVIAPEQVDAFNEGVLAGQQAAIDGLPVAPQCVSLAQEVSPAAETDRGRLLVARRGGLAPHDPRGRDEVLGITAVPVVEDLRP